MRPSSVRRKARRSAECFCPMSLTSPWSLLSALQVGDLIALRRSLSSAPVLAFHDCTTAMRLWSCAAAPLTVTVNVCADAELPRASVAVQLTVVVPMANTDPDALEQDGVNAAPKPSAAVAV